MKATTVNKLTALLVLACALNATPNAMAATNKTKHAAAKPAVKVVSHKAPSLSQKIAPAPAYRYSADQYEAMNKYLWDQYMNKMQTLSNQYPTVQNYPVNNYLAQPVYSEYDSPTLRDARLEAARRAEWERYRQRAAETAMHALIEHYGTPNGSADNPFGTLERQTQEAVHAADLLRYGQTHTHANPETNIAPN
jgi:hypothetical protein